MFLNPITSTQSSVAREPEPVSEMAAGKKRTSEKTDQAFGSKIPANPGQPTPPKARKVSVVTKEERRLEDGTILNGKFRNDIFVSGTLTDKYGIIHKGSFKNNKLHGTGIRQFPDGTQQIGNFENGNLAGVF